MRKLVQNVYNFLLFNKCIFFFFINASNSTVITVSCGFASKNPYSHVYALLRNSKASCRFVYHTAKGTFKTDISYFFVTS